MLHTTLSDRSRDNLPNPIQNDLHGGRHLQGDSVYVPQNMRAIGDLFDLFNFGRRDQKQRSQLPNAAEIWRAVSWSRLRTEKTRASIVRSPEIPSTKKPQDLFRCFARFENFQPLFICH